MESGLTAFTAGKTLYEVLRNAMMGPCGSSTLLSRKILPDMVCFLNDRRPQRGSLFMILLVHLVSPLVQLINDGLTERSAAKLLCLLTMFTVSQATKTDMPSASPPSRGSDTVVMHCTLLLCIP